MRLMLTTFMVTSSQRAKSDVTEIGNNVMLDFGEFDFSEKQPSRLVISGKSLLALNSIHLILNGSEGESRILCEFRTDDSENYV